MNLSSNQVSIIFNPRTDDMNAVIDSVERMFLVFGDANDGDTQGAAANQPAAGGVDVTGLPWDARIHSTPAGTKNDGTWRAKRNVAAATVAAVTAELRALQAQHQSAPLAPAAAPLAPAAAPATLPLPPLTALTPAAPSAYERLTKIFAENLNSAENPAGRISTEWMRSFLQGNGVPDGNLASAATMPEADLMRMGGAVAGALGVTF